MDDSRQLRQILESVGDGVYLVNRERRIQLWNRSAEKITGFGANEVMGHCCAENILCHVDQNGKSLCQGHCPLAQTMADGQPREAIINLHHKDGYRVPVQVSVQPLYDDQGQITGAVETFRECSDILAMRSTIELLKQRGCVDLATGLANRRIIEARLEDRMQELQRYGWPFGLLMAEVDHLDEVAEKFGPKGRGEAIRIAAMSMQNALRSLDAVGRWDQNTFLATVANTTAGELGEIAERVRMLVETAYRELDEGQLHVTVSIGAVQAGPRDDAQTLVQKASRCVYESRSQGRNRVTVFIARENRSGV